jgi:hypothetical protein
VRIELICELNKIGGVMESMKKKNILRIVFFVVWLGITFAWFWAFGENLFLAFPSFFLFSTYVVFFIAVPIFYYGKIIAKWEWKKLGIVFVVMMVIIPIGTRIHLNYLNVSEENSLHEFITSVKDGNIPDKFIGYDPEDVKCLENYITPEYTLNQDFFFGMTDWWVTFENEEKFYLSTQRIDFSQWDINIDCYK